MNLDKLAFKFYTYIYIIYSMILNSTYSHMTKINLEQKCETHI